MKNRFVVKYFDDIKEDLKETSKTLTQLKEEYKEVLESGISFENFMDMIEYDYKIYSEKNCLEAMAAFYSKEECEEKRFHASLINANIISKEDAKSKVLALYLANNELNK